MHDTLRCTEGLVTPDDQVFVVYARGDVLASEVVIVLSNADGREYELETILLQPYAQGGQFARWTPPPSRRWLVCPYRRAAGDRFPTLLSPLALEREVPRTWAWLRAMEPRLRARTPRPASEGRAFYAFDEPGALYWSGRPRFECTPVAATPCWSYDARGDRLFPPGEGGGFAVECAPTPSPEWTLAWLNCAELLVAPNPLDARPDGRWRVSLDEVARTLDAMPSLDAVSLATRAAVEREVRALIAGSGDEAALRATLAAIVAR